ATSGNISVQIDKLEKAKYIKVKKGYKGKVPQTVCRITPQGIQALADHVQALKSYLNLNI
ncbi:MAG: transcriptional regulator, partial [Prevotella pallens]|nr:transcriptional regulator [Prevotella pallens]